MTKLLSTSGRQASMLGAGIVIGLLVGVPLTARVGSQPGMPSANDVRVVNKSDDAVYVRFSTPDDGRKVIVSNDASKPVKVDPVSTIKVETTNWPAVLKVAPTTYTYKFYNRDALLDALRPIPGGNQAEKFVNFLNAGGWELVDSSTTATTLTAAGYEAPANTYSVMLRKAVAP